MCVLIFLSKSCIKISWTCDQITHYIYNFFIYFLFFYNIPSFIKKNYIQIVQSKASFMITYIRWSASKATIYKTIPIVNKAPLSKLTSCLIYISHVPNETWSSFVKLSTSSSILLKLLLICGCSNTAIATEIYFLKAIINKQF